MGLPVLNAFLDDDGRTITVVEQGPEGPKARRIRATYASHHLASELDARMMRLLKASDKVAGIYREGERWVRVAWRSEGDRRTARYKLREANVEAYEADVDPVMYWLVASKATIARPRRVYLDFEADSHVSLARKEDMRVLSYGLCDHETGKTWSVALEEDDDDAEADLLRRLVGELEAYDQICVWEGDWKGGEFDSILFEARCRKRGIGVDPRRWVWLNQLAVWKRMNMHSAESGAEKESFKLEDIAFEQLGEGKSKTPQFVVDRFGAKLCSRGLGAMTRELYDAGGEFRELLLKYNARDAEILRELELKKQYITLFQALCEVCGIVPETRSLQPTRQMDGFLLRLGREHDHRFPSKAFREEGEEELGQFKGAVVFHPKSVADDSKGWSADEARAWREKHGFKNGILRNVHVCDFASLYPSVMRTFNLDGSTIAGWQTERDFRDNGLKPGTIRSPGTNLLTTSSRKGFIPLAFETLVFMRKKFADLAATLPPGSAEWKDAMAISTAYKVAANSFYGGGASRFSRFNNRDASEACTQNGVHFLKLTASEGEKRGMVLVYGDTDSNMVLGPTFKGYRAFVEWLNKKRFPAEVASFGCVENHIKLAFEKSFERIVFVSAKAYVGRYAQYKGVGTCNRCKTKKGSPGAVDVVTLVCEDCGHQYKEIPPGLGDPEIKGVAWKRGDKGKLARELQGKIIDLLVGGVMLKDAAGRKVPANPGIKTPTEDVSVYERVIEAARDHVLVEPLPLEEVRLSKSLSRSLREYGKEATEAHVRVARELEARGVVVGKGVRVEYVVVDGSKSPQLVIPADDYAGDCDRFYLWERVYEPSKSLLSAAFPDLDWEKWGDVRPAKARARSKTPEGQLGLSLSEKRPPADFDELAIPAFRVEPLVVRIPEEVGEEGLVRVQKALLAHPGARAVEIVIVTKQGAEAVLASSLRVSTGPKLRAAVDDALRPSAGPGAP